MFSNRTGRRAITAILLLAGLALPPATVAAEEPMRFAQASGDNGEDLDQMFESMEEEGPEETEADESLLTRFWSNSTLKVNSWNDLYMHSPDDDRTHPANLIGTEQLYFESQLNMNRNIFYLETWYEWSNLESAYSQDAIFKQSENERRNRLHLKQMYYTWTLEDYDINLGKKLVESGYASLYSPTDRYNRSDLTDPIHPRSEGVWQASAHYYHGNATTRFHFMPAYEPGRSPPDPSRWSASQSGGTFNANFNTLGNSTTDYPTAQPTDWQYLLHHERTFTGWDVFGQLFHGQFGPVVVQDGVQNREEYFKVLTLTGGAQLVLDRWKYYGEVLYQNPYDNVDDSFFKGVIGAKYSFDESVRPYGLKKVELTGEYAGEDVTDDFDNSDVLFSTRDTRPGRNSYLFKSNFKQTDDLRYILVTEIDRDKESEFYGLGVKHNYSGNLNLNGWAEFFNADSDSQISHWSDNDRLVASVEYFF